MSDVVGVTDSLGNAVTASVTVTTTNPVVVSPAQVTLSRLASQTFIASGGSGVYPWTYGTNARGAR